jgi:hypothetical protein
MVALLAAISTFTYLFPVQPVSKYTVKATFDGYVPILGGQTGVAVVDLGIATQGREADSEGHPRVRAELESIHVKFNDAVFPIDIDSTRDYYPPTTYTLTPEGRVLKSDAPAVHLPIRLPGLDIQRIPDITFLPIEFSTEGIHEGSKWDYRKSFGDSDVMYSVETKKVDDHQAEFEVTLSETFDTLEDAAGNLAKDPRDAVSKVHTEMKGHGTAIFDLGLHQMSSSVIEATAKSHASPMEKGVEPSDRELKTKIECNLANGPQAKPPVPVGQPTKLQKIQAKFDFLLEVARMKANHMSATAQVEVSKQIAYLQRLLEAWVR